MANRQQTRDRQTARFRLERNTVLRSLDVKMMDAFFLRWKAPLPSAWHTGKPDAQLACMHYARIQCTDMRPDEKVASAKWLLEKTYTLPSGYTLDGDKLIFNKPDQQVGPDFGTESPDGDK